jgi:DNA modification methylase
MAIDPIYEDAAASFMELDHIYWGDARDHSKTLPTGSVDFILCDPPYNLRRYSTGNIKMPWRSDFNNDIAGWDDTPFIPADWLSEFRRVLAPAGNICAFTSYNLLGAWHNAFDPVFDTFQVMVWHKTNPPPKLRRAGFLNSCEFMVWCWNKGHTWNFSKQSEMHNHIESGICQGKERLKMEDGRPFATQKPLKVLKHLVELGSRPGDLIYDPFMGVGSIGEAALLLDRRFIGVELGEEEFSLADKRLAPYRERNVA